MTVKTGNVFRIEIVSENTPYTKDVVAELARLFESSDKISEWQIKELYESIKLFEKKEKEA